MPLGTPKSETSGDIIKLTNENKVYNLKQQFLYFFLAQKKKRKKEWFFFPGYFPWLTCVLV